MTTNTHKQRNYSEFEADFSGAALNYRLLKRLLRWMRPYWFTLTTSIVLVSIASIMTILLPIILSVVVIDFILKNSSDTLAPDFGLVQLTEWLANLTGWPLLFAASLLFVTSHLIWTFAIHFHQTTLNLAVVNTLRDLRHDLFEHLETRPSSFYDNVSTGRIMTRVTNDIEALYELLRGLGSLLGELLPFLFALVVMISVSFQMSFILLCYIPILVIVTLVFRRYSRRLFRLVRQTVASLNQNLQENLNGLQVVQLSNREEFNRRRYQNINHNNLKLETSLMRRETVYTSFNDSMAAVAIGIILWFAGGKVIQNEISLGGMILFTRFIDMLFHPVVVLGEQINILFRAMASGERIFQALDWDESIHEPTKPTTLPQRIEGRVEYRNLTFAYRDEPVLKDVSFIIEPGEKLAIVGTTGSGKSTLIRLLSRLYDVPNQSIFIDGIDVNDILTRDLRKRIGVVLQDFHIFSGTIMDNISLGDEAINESKIVAAAKLVNAHHFISSLPNGYHTVLSERGQNISQGQRQLLAFARVVAADPALLVLDEATANIDTETELLIQDALRKLTAGRTSIIVAHRLQTIQDANRVLVMENGVVAELGTQTELLETKGKYFKLHQYQFQQDTRMSV